MLIDQTNDEGRRPNASAADLRPSSFVPEVERARAGFTAECYARLVQLKDVYGPDNLFRLSANNIPATRSLVVVP